MITTPHLNEAAQLLVDNLPQAGNLTQFIIDAAEVAINYCSADFTIVFANKTYAAIHGLTPDQIISRQIIEVIGSAAYETSLPYYKRALQGERVVYETELSMPIGVRYVQCIYNPIFGKANRVLGWVGVIIDMTERHKLEKQLQKNEKSLRVEKDKAEAANVAKSEFLANMSHELRTPMNAIIGISHILSRQLGLGEKQRTYIETLKSSADTLLMLINDLLDLSKIEAQSMELESIPFELNKILQEISSMMEMRIQEKRLDFHLDIAASADYAFEGDPTKISQIVMNLCSNAIKFTETGGVSLTVKPFDGSQNTANIEIIVRDTGVGIQPEKLDKIFDKFTQADSSITRRYGGTGLGLAITKRLIELMGGSITVSSKPATGSVFTVILPLKIIQTTNSEAQTNAISSSRAPLQSLPSDKPRILVVEDYAANAMVAALYLEEFGYDYDIAESGHEALEKISQKNYHAILMDVQMQGIDGLETTRMIRERELQSGTGNRIRIIGLTANAMISDRELCLAAGMDDYLTKPYKPLDFQMKLMG